MRHGWGVLAAWRCTIMGWLSCVVLAVMILAVCVWPAVKSLFLLKLQLSLSVWYPRYMNHIQTSTFPSKNLAAQYLIKQGIGIEEWWQLLAPAIYSEGRADLTASLDLFFLSHIGHILQRWQMTTVMEKIKSCSMCSFWWVSEVRLLYFQDVYPVVVQKN